MVTKDWRDRTRLRLLVLCALCLVLGWGSILLSGCQASIPSSDDTQVTTDEEGKTESESDTKQTEPQAEEGKATSEQADDETSGGESEELPPLPDECHDRHDCLTAFAVTELEGPDFVRLLSELGYVWSERNQLWAKENGSASLVIHDGEGNLFTEAQLADIDGPVIEEPLVFRAVTSSYSTPKKAFNAVASKSMVVEDSEFADTSAVGVVTSPSEKRCLVFVSATNDVQAVTLMGEAAVSAGLFDREARGEFGSTIDTVFERLTGRALEEVELQEP